MNAFMSNGCATSASTNNGCTTNEFMSNECTTSASTNSECTTSASEKTGCAPGTGEVRDRAYSSADPDQLGETTTVHVVPAASMTPAGTSSIWMRTGTR